MIWCRLDDNDAVVIPGMPLGRSLPPKSRWKQTKVTMQNQVWNEC